MAHRLPRWEPARRNAATFAELMRLDARSVISHRIDFTDANTAYGLVDSRAGDVMGVLLTYPNACPEGVRS